MNRLLAREVRSFDKDWRFTTGDCPGAIEPGYNDDEWRCLDLPHDWSIEADFDEKLPHGREQGFLPRWEIGWYRKRFRLEQELGNSRVFIQFDGVFHNSEVWVNGSLIGKRPYGYVSFEYDLTPALVFGAENVIVVKVDNSIQPADRWYSGAGIYRHVWLNITDKLHVKNWGTAVTTPEMTDDCAVVKIATTIDNSYADQQDCRLATTIFDSEGREIARLLFDVQIPGEECRSIEQEASIPEPRRWELDRPALYSAHSSLLLGERVLDDYITPFGIRELRYDCEKGFFLNGKHMKLKGVNLHHDLGCLGTAVHERAIERRLERLKELGCNAIRCSHNPPAPELLNLCDRMGFLVIDEAFDKWTWTEGYYYRIFEEWWEQDLEAMLFRDRNHPCIIMWSVGNEVENQGSDEMLDILDRLVKHVKAIEPTRPVTYALAPHCDTQERIDAPVAEKVELTVRMAEKVDILSCNYHEQWYEDYRRALPETLILGTECYPFFRGRWENFLALEPVNPWFDVARHDYVIGQFLWPGIDYLGEANPWPSKGWAAGLIDTCGALKPRAYFHQSVWSDEPMVHIAVFDETQRSDLESAHWTWPKIASHWTFPHFRNEVVRVVTFTNCRQVELLVNGKSAGIKALADYPDHMIIWYLPYEEGEITARALNEGREICTHSLITAGPPDRIELLADREQIKADGRDIAHIEVSIVDEGGIVVPSGDHDITFSIQGAGRIIGVDNGDLCSSESYKTNHRRAFRGRCLVIVQSDGNEGVITLTATGDGVKTGKLSLHAK